MFCEIKTTLINELDWKVIGKLFSKVTIKKLNRFITKFSCPLSYWKIASMPLVCISF